MRQIGVNQFVGDHPAIIESLQEIHVEIEKQKEHDKNKFGRLNPSQKFFHILNNTINRPLKFGQNDKDCELYQYKEYTFMELEKVQEWTGVPDCKDFVVLLNIIYVCDGHRMNGYGGQAMKLLQDTCNKSGAVLILFCNPFGIGQYGKPYAITNPKDFTRYWFDDNYDTTYYPKSDAKLTQFFYKQNGLINMCLYDEWIYDRDKEDDLPIEQQFAYLPDNLLPKYREQLSDRLNIELCKWCNR